MPRIINKNKTYRVDLGDGEYIDVRDQLSFKEFTELTEKENDKNMVFDLLKMVIIDWNIYDENRRLVPFQPELISDFDLSTATEVLKKAMKRYVPDKKKVELLTESLSTDLNENATVTMPS
jgi:hypothetical protein